MQISRSIETGEKNIWNSEHIYKVILRYKKSKTICDCEWSTLTPYDIWKLKGQIVELKSKTNDW